MTLKKSIYTKLDLKNMAYLVETQQVFLRDQENDHVVDLIIRRHPQAKSIKLRCDHREPKVYLTVPRKTSIRTALRFFHESKDWVLKHLPVAVVDNTFKPAGVVPLLGKQYQINHIPCDKSPLKKSITTAGENLYFQGKPQDLHTCIVQWLIGQAEAYFYRKSHEVAEHHGVTIKKIRIKNLRSCWGSCSSHGNISYSWRLIMAPRYVADYICAHEVSHRLEMNHSARFWSLVSAVCPDFKEARSWLRSNGKNLYWPTV